jgi:hypothetical protein
MNIDYSVTKAVAAGINDADEASGHIVGIVG